MKKDYNALLHEKMKSEYDLFISDLMKMSPEEIIEKSYEKVFKEEILLCCENTEFSNTEAKALYYLNSPLEEIYREWCDNDYSYTELINDTISDRSKDAIKEMKERGKANER